jgi:hypothetical protein
MTTTAKKKCRQTNKKRKIKKSKDKTTIIKHYNTKKINNIAKTKQKTKNHQPIATAVLPVPGLPASKMARPAILPS